MGCFFGCFRIRAGDRHQSHIVSKSISSRDQFVSKNQLASVFLREEEKGSPCHKTEELDSRENVDKDSVVRELRNEAKFLKSCGAILYTPEEIRKAAEKINSRTTDEEGISSVSSPRLSGASPRKLFWDDQPDQPSSSPKKMHVDVSAPERISVSSNSDGDQTIMHNGCVLPSVTTSKSVQFEDVKHVYGVESLSDSVCFEDIKHVSQVESIPDSVCLDLSPSRTEGEIREPASSHSSYPTPLKLTDEMQTPGTVYAAKLEDFATGKKNARIRTQYVFPVLNPVENSSQWRMLRDGSHHCGQSSDLFEQKNYLDGHEVIDRSIDKDSHHTKSIPKDQCGSPESPSSVIPPSNTRETASLSTDKPQRVAMSFSQWLKPPPANTEKSWTSEETRRERAHSTKSSDGDRPIIGMVAAHWNADEPSRVSPKWWDGNGIPNSTNKYKEDQKVSWHATPFEERLEKALSDEKLFPHRNIVDGKLCKIGDEGEEDDTAAS